MHNPVLTILVPFLLFSVLVGVGIFLVFYFSNQESQARKEIATTEACIVANSVQSELRKLQAPFQLLQSYVHQFPSSPGFFNRSYSQLGLDAMELIGENKSSHKDHGSIYCLWLCPLGRLSYWYPPDSPDGSMSGRDWLGPKSPFRSLLLQQAVSGTHSLVGPNPAKPATGITLQMFFPIFINDVDANETFGEATDASNCLNCYNNNTRTKWWGFSFILVIFDRFINERIAIGNLKTKFGLDFQLVYDTLSVINGTSIPSRLVLAGQNSSMPSDSLSFPVIVDAPSSQWTLYVKNSQGWLPSYTWPLVAVVIIVSLVLSILLSLYLASVLQRLGYQFALEISNDELERSKGSLLKEKGRMEALLLRHHDLILCLEGGKGQGDRLSLSATGSDSTPSSLLSPNSGPMEERSRITKLANQLMNQATSGIQLIDYLGSGSYGKVYKGIWQGQFVAVKSVILPSSMTQLEKRITMAMMEVAVSAKLSHPSIVQTFTYRLRPLDGKQASANSGIISQAKTFHSDGTHDANKGDGRGTMVVPSGILLGGAGASTRMNDSSLYTSSATSPPGTPPAMSGMTEQYQSQSGEAPPQGLSPAPSASPSSALPVVAYEVLLVLELMEGGNMWEALRRGLTKKPDGSVDRKTVLTILANVAAGLLHLHANDVCHSDVKAENVMLKGEGRPVVAKLGDFGLALDFNGADKTHQSKVFQGTPTHMAPETLRLGRVGKPSDVYAFGIMMYEMWSAMRPYTTEQSPNQAVLVGNVVEGMRPLWSRMAHDPPLVPYQLLAEQCWQEDPLARPLFPEICERIAEMMGLPDSESRVTIRSMLRAEEEPREELIEIQVGGDEKSEREVEIMQNDDQMEKGGVTGRRETQSARISGLTISSSLSSLNTPVKRITSFRTVSSKFNSTLLPIRESEDPSTSGRKLIPVSGGAILVGIESDHEAQIEL